MVSLLAACGTETEQPTLDAPVSEPTPDAGPLTCDTCLGKRTVLTFPGPVYDAEMVGYRQHLVYLDGTRIVTQRRRQTTGELGSPVASGETAATSFVPMHYLETEEIVAIEETADATSFVYFADEGSGHYVRTASTELPDRFAAAVRFDFARPTFAFATHTASGFGRGGIFALDDTKQLVEVEQLPPFLGIDSMARDPFFAKLFVTGVDRLQELDDHGKVGGMVEINDLQLVGTHAFFGFGSSLETGLLATSPTHFLHAVYNYQIDKFQQISPTPIQPGLHALARDELVTVDDEAITLSAIRRDGHVYPIQRVPYTEDVSSVYVGFGSTATEESIRYIVLTNPTAHTITIFQQTATGFHSAELF